jgi:histidinol-phosphate/aromatic aminotransferase/cobyric acid decarboxylase-like protein
MRELPAAFTPYQWAISTAEAARIAGIRPDEVLRFDANTAPAPPRAARPETLANALGQVHRYSHGGMPDLVAAIAAYAGAEPENVVLGAGADDLILLAARAFAGPGDRVAITDEPTYPLFRVAAWLAGAEVGGERPAVTFCCRPHNPTGALVDIPPARPLVVDEAYHEYCGETAALLDEGVVVIRTFSKAFALAGARVGYALATPEVARELAARQSPAPISTLSAALALAVLAEPPDVRPLIEERERLAGRLRELGLEPLPSHANFLYVPLEEAPEVARLLLAEGMLVRDSPEAIRITVLDARSNERLVERLETALDRMSGS